MYIFARKHVLRPTVLQILRSAPQLPSERAPTRFRQCCGRHPADGTARTAAMWLWFATVVAALLQTGPAHSNSGLTSTSFSNELRTGFARLFQNGVEQPVQPSPFVLLQRDPVVDFRVGNPLLQQRPVQYGPPEPTFQSPPRPRYELQYQSWAIPYYYVPARFHPGFGKSRPNDVLVVVVKTGSNCTGAANGTTPADDDADDDGDDKVRFEERNAGEGVNLCGTDGFGKYSMLLTVVFWEPLRRVGTIILEANIKTIDRNPPYY